MTGIFRHLLVATDGSATGNRAVAFAVSLAQRHNSDIVFCNVVDHAAAVAESSTANGGFGVLVPLVQSLDDAANSILAEAAKRATDAGVTATTAVLDGQSAPAIVMLAHERNVDAIVMGTQGKRGLERFFMGSTADGVLRRTDVPTFVVPPSAGDAEPSFERILVAIDDSDPSDAAAFWIRVNCLQRHRPMDTIRPRCSMNCTQRHHHS
jgi:nucleotide-binding universal stress UspA family protein